MKQTLKAISPFSPLDPTKDSSAMGNTQTQTGTEKIYAVFSGVCSTLKLVYHISIILITTRFEKKQKNLELFLQNQNGTIVFNWHVKTITTFKLGSSLVAILKGLTANMQREGLFMAASWTQWASIKFLKVSSHPCNVNSSYGVFSSGM